MFVLHNETFNIWTHLLGFILVFILIFSCVAYQMEQSHILGKMIISSYVEPYKINETEFIKALGFNEDWCSTLNSGL